MWRPQAPTLAGSSAHWIQSRPDAKWIDLTEVYDLTGGSDSAQLRHVLFDQPYTRFLQCLRIHCSNCCIRTSRQEYRCNPAVQCQYRPLQDLTETD